MEVPFEDYDVNTMIDAIQKVKALLSREFSTFFELDSAIAEILAPYKRYGDGFERFHADLTTDAAKEDLHTLVSVMKLHCDASIEELRNSQKDPVNDLLSFINDTSRILVHGSGSLLALAIACAIEVHEGVQFFICEGRTQCGPLDPNIPDDHKGAGVRLLEKVPHIPEGTRLGEKLHKYCTLIPDSAVSSVLNSVDFVVMGAFCVTEHGGLVNSPGSLQVASAAFSRNIPRYVLCHTFKFAQVFPLSTEDLKQPDAAGVVPLVEFVPSTLITLIFSEKGIMPPSAVTDMMFQFHTARSAPRKTTKSSA